MDKWVGKVAVVTGASSGIGAETCKKLVASGMIVVGLARRENLLKDLSTELNGQPGEFHYFKVDLCNEETILKAFEWIKSTFKSLDVLINNGGVLKSADLLNGSTTDWKLMFDTNLIGLNICSREAVKLMQHFEIERGHIININSIAGQMQLPGNYADYAVYSATKFGVTALTKYLRDTLSINKLPIRVTSISPGIVETEMTIDLTRPTGGIEVLQPEDIADAILYALSAPQRANVCEITIRPTGDTFTPKD
ncbi:farnesol dehydrogenase-like [Adelges cooleyi]|uniref:farnesol dehydrogenase-like n=1 Tax=Adelges cooleyi TaxID=133065 RepID=UPI0021800591|nr:farnesol dehydrogenase-like [Adelges cooleyi]